MVEIICSRSGLKFEAENRRTKVHPKISYYTSHKNWDLRYAAVAVIDRGKAESWDTIEKFEEEIQKALNPEPQPRPDYDFEGDWAARITGSSEKYRFEREFLAKVDVEGRFKRYAIANNGDGIYETCYESAKGNQTRRYWRVQDGEMTQISLEDVEALFPKIQIASVENCRKVSLYFPESTTVEYDGQIYFVVRVDSVNHWEDEDGVAGTGYHSSDTYIVWEETRHTSYLRPANDDEITQHQQHQVKLAQQQKKNDAVKRLKEIGRTIVSANGAIAPESTDYPIGKTFVLEQGHFQANKVLILQGLKLWSLIYNGRDGDDWSCNNVAGCYVGNYLEIPEELKLEVEKLMELVNC